jgi:dTDP-4-dehydrorhamnose 3,5-epimerase
MHETVRVTDLSQVHGPQGKVMHMLRSTDPMFTGFGEIYFSTIYPGVVKAWHKHAVKTVNLAVIHGLARIVAYTPEKGAVARVIGPENYKLISIPPGVWYGFQCIGPETAIIADCATHPFDAAEQTSLPPDATEIPFDWED